MRNINIRKLIKLGSVNYLICYNYTIIVTILMATLDVQIVNYYLMLIKLLICIKNSQPYILRPKSLLFMVKNAVLLGGVGVCCLKLDIPLATNFLEEIQNSIQNNNKLLPSLSVDSDPPELMSCEIVRLISFSSI